MLFSCIGLIYLISFITQSQCTPCHFTSSVPYALLNEMMNFIYSIPSYINRSLKYISTSILSMRAGNVISNDLSHGADSLNSNNDILDLAIRASTTLLYLLMKGTGYVIACASLLIIGYNKSTSKFTPIIAIIFMCVCMRTQNANVVQLEGYVIMPFPNYSDFEITLSSNVMTVKGSGLIEDSVLTNFKYYPSGMFPDDNVRTIVFTGSNKNLSLRHYTSFNKYINLETVRFDQYEGLVQINSGAFHSCYNLALMVFPPKLDLCGTNCFYNNSLTEIRVPPCIYLDRDCFCNCKKLKTAYLMGTMMLSQDLFKGCESLTDVYYCSVVPPSQPNPNYAPIIFTLDGVSGSSQANKVRVHVPIMYNQSYFCEVDITNANKDGQIEELEGCHFVAPQPTKTPSLSPSPSQTPTQSPTASRSPLPSNIPTESHMIPVPAQTPTRQITQARTDDKINNPNNAVDESNKNKGKKSNNAMIIGGAVGGFLFLLLLILIILYIVYKTSKHAIDSDEEYEQQFTNDDAPLNNIDDLTDDELESYDTQQVKPSEEDDIEFEQSSQVPHDDIQKDEEVEEPVESIPMVINDVNPTEVQFDGAESSVPGTPNTSEAAACVGVAAAASIKRKKKVKRVTKDQSINQESLINNEEIVEPKVDSEPVPPPAPVMAPVVRPKKRIKKRTKIIKDTNMLEQELNDMNEDPIDPPVEEQARPKKVTRKRVRKVRMDPVLTEVNELNP